MIDHNVGVTPAQNYEIKRIDSSFQFIDFRGNEMLKKPEVINIPKDDPWISDKLDRATAANNLTKLVRSLTQPFVISITSPWGTGKTTLGTL